MGCWSCFFFFVCVYGFFVSLKYVLVLLFVAYFTFGVVLLFSNGGLEVGEFQCLCSWRHSVLLILILLCPF